MYIVFSHARLAGAVAAVALIAALPGLHAGYDPEWELKFATRFSFQIDPKIRMADLLPSAPAVAQLTAISVVDDLTCVPEVALQEFSAQRCAKPNDKDNARATTMEARKLIAHLLAKINHINREGADHFIEMLRTNRPDLAGLPFHVGESARLNPSARRRLGEAIAEVRRLQESGITHSRDVHFRLSQDGFTAAALTQMLAIRPRAVTTTSTETSVGLVQLLAINHSDEATRGLMRVAVFSPEVDQRSAALEVLRKRRTLAAGDIVRRGLRYPWPAIVRNAAEAVIALERTDLGYDLADMLEAADPRLPRQVVVYGKQVHLVRELVRINHHRNCLLCHPPANTPDVIRPGAVNELNMFADRQVAALTGEVSSPGVSLPIRDAKYNPFASEFPDLLVRADVTYLRQDFSLLQEVVHTAPWPAMQRFDYLLRERALSATEAEGYQATLAARRDFGEHRQVALAALRRLTGVDLGESADAWRDMLWTAAAWRTARHWAIGGSILVACMLVCCRLRLVRQTAHFARAIANSRVR